MEKGLGVQELSGNISLLYKDGIHPVSSDGLSEEDSEQLELYELIDLHGSGFGGFFTTDIDTILYRQRMFADLSENPGLTQVLLKMTPFLSDITELRRMSSQSAAVGDAYLYSISEVEIYVSLMDLLRDELLPYRDKVSSPAFCAFIERISRLTESDYYKNLTEKMSELASRVRDIKSVTIGVNLDSRLSPSSAGVLSVNSEPFKSGDFFEKVMRLDFKKDDMTCIAELIPFRKGQSENQQLALTNAFNAGISEVFKSSVRSWKKAVSYYVVENTDFLLRMAPEIEFVTKGAELIEKLRARGCPLCTPTIRPMEEKKFNCRSLCNPVIAMKTNAPLVPNDFAFDDKGMIYVITGPNRGGKSVITCAVGHAFAMAQSGLPVCAQSAELSPCDRILTHFPTGSEDTVEKGRLGEECSRLCHMFDNVTKYSLVLLDESLSSTGSFEGAYIAGEVLSGFSMAGCRGIFSTHLHDLAASVDKINGECVPNGGSPVDNMVAQVEDGSRTFRIIRRSPDGKSYARDIADKYGLSLDKILDKISKRS